MNVNLDLYACLNLLKHVLTECEDSSPCTLELTHLFLELAYLAHFCHIGFLNLVPSLKYTKRVSILAFLSWCSWSQRKHSSGTPQLLQAGGFCYSLHNLLFMTNSTFPLFFFWMHKNNTNHFMCIIPSCL